MRELHIFKFLCFTLFRVHRTHCKINFFVKVLKKIFFIGFFHTVHYNIENWVWICGQARTRTLAATCCMLSEIMYL